MTQQIELIQSIQDYIDKHDLDYSVEEMFAHFEEIYLLKLEFNDYLISKGLNKKLRSMKRSKRKLEKRKLFCQWFSLKHQNDKNLKTVTLQLSEMVFTSTRTVENDLFNW